MELIEASDGRLKRGTVYVTLDRMEDKGLVESWTEDAPEGHRGPPRRKYRVTGLGEAALAGWQERVASVFNGLTLAPTPVSMGLVVAVPLGGPSLWYVVVPATIVFLLLAAAVVHFTRRRGSQATVSETIASHHILGTALPQSWMENAVIARVGDTWVYKIDGEQYFVSMDGGGEVDITWGYTGGDSHDRSHVMRSVAMNLREALIKSMVQPRERLVAPKPARPPGGRLMGIIRTVYPTKRFERVFDPLYADFCADYFEACKGESVLRQRVLVLRFYYDLVKTAGVLSAARLAGHFLGEIRETLKIQD